MLITPKARMMYPMALERRYAKELRRYVRDEMAIVKEYVPAMITAVMANSIRKDEDEPETDDDWIAALLALLFGDIARRLTVRQKVLEIFDDVRNHAKKEYDKVMRSVFGSTTMPPSSYASDMKKMKDLFTYQNLKLISSIDDEIREGLYYTLAQNAVSTADRATVERQITDYIKKRTHLSENRAVLICADQTGKLFGQINQYLQQADGIDSYIWRTMKDNRVRPAHKEREGQVFRWDDPPSDGHPGYAIRCRCHGEPVINSDKNNQAPIRGRFNVIS